MEEEVATVFISFEGIDGAGKTTQIRAIEDYLTEIDIPFISLREPGGTGVGEEIRRLLKDPKYGPLEPATEVFLLSASRRQILVEEVGPALQDKTWVILDRYVDSTTAYQAYGRGLDLEMVESVNSLATEGILPHYTFLLDIDPEIARTRFKQRGNANSDRIEAESLDDEGFSFMKRVREGYLALERKYPERYIKIDAAASQEDITHEILNYIKEWTK